MYVAKCTKSFIENNVTLKKRINETDENKQLFDKLISRSIKDLL